jgi:hypothetical protein
MKNTVKKVEGYAKIASSFESASARANELVNEGYQPRKAISIAALGGKTPVIKKK